MGNPRLRSRSDVLGGRYPRGRYKNYHNVEEYVRFSPDRCVQDRSVHLAAFESMSPDTLVRGTVVTLVRNEAIVAVKLPGGERALGLLHRTEMKPIQSFKQMSQEVWGGQRVEVRITGVNHELGFLSLSQATQASAVLVLAADLSAFEVISPDQWLTGKVAQVAEFGAFVTVTAPNGKAMANGLVHSTQIKDGLVESMKKELKPDQAVQVRIQALDVLGGTMSLTMK